MGDHPTYPLYLIALAPLIGAAINLIFGRWLSRGAVHFIAVASVAASFGVAVWLIAGPLWDAFQAWRHAGSTGPLPALDQVAYRWIEVGAFKVDLAFHLDTLTAVMVLIITFVGTLIHIYSTGYMADEKRYAAYFGYLNLFTGAMLILVLAANLPVMFIGWEGVGLCSYLLIGFWFSKEANANAGRKAFVVNRIGDFAFLLGMFLLYWATKDIGGPGAASLDFGVLRSEAAQQVYVQPFWAGEHMSFWIGLFLFIGACGKSAQIPLYVWLPDAMAGPTPVSALIHAATMVTAGVYMIARLSFLYASSTTAMAIVCGVGALTALVAAFMAFAQTDLKKVLAYSTVSQLGFMFVGVGSGAYVAGVFHLLTHAFFKAGLFLGAGSVMHAMHAAPDPGDITKMGGLRGKLKHTHWTFLIFCVAIAGIVPFSGFFSKDEILAGAWFADGEGWPEWYGEFIWAVLSVAALGTAIYMFRLYFLVFAGESRADAETEKHIHESPASMTVPLMVLAVATVLLGGLGLPHLSSVHLPTLLHDWLAPSIAHVGEGTHVVASSDPAVIVAQQAAEKTHDLWTLGLMGFALLVGATGIFIAYRLYRKGPSETVARLTADGTGKQLYEASKHKLWVDEFYEAVIIRPFRAVSRLAFEFVDRFVIDLIFVNGTGFVVQVASRVARRLQNGQVQRYMVGLILGAAAIFFLTSRHQADFSYALNADGMLHFEADIGAGPTAQAAIVRWDFDGDGKADLVPGSEGKQPPQYVSDARIDKLPGEVAAWVTVWITDGIFGETRSVKHRVQLPSTPVSRAAAEPKAEPISEGVAP